MKDLLTFMGEHPILTFFLVLMIGQTIIYSFKYIAYAVSRTPPPVEKDEDE